MRLCPLRELPEIAPGHVRAAKISARIVEKSEKQERAARKLAPAPVIGADGVVAVGAPAETEIEFKMRDVKENAEIKQLGAELRAQREETQSREAAVTSELYRDGKYAAVSRNIAKTASAFEAALAERDALIRTRQKAGYALPNIATSTNWLGGAPW